MNTPNPSPRPLRLLAIALTCFIGVGDAAPAQDEWADPKEKQALKLIKPSWIKKHIRIIASDDMEGRETGTRGCRAAAEHIKKQFQEAKLESLASDGSYFQRWDLKQAPSVRGCSVRWRRGRKKGTLEVRRATVPPRERHFTVFNFSGSGEAQGDVVFAGYGITAPEYEWDDYGQIDAKDKIVIVLRGEPRRQRDDGWKGRADTEHAKALSKYGNAIAHGAIGFMLVSDPVNYKPDRRAPQPHEGGNAAPVAPLRDDGKSIPALWMHYDAVSRMIGNDRKILEWQREMDESMKSGSRPIPKLDAIITVGRGGRLPTKNVVAFLEGSDQELREEWVVVGAHYDHVGLLRRGKDRINNGADDNGSGTVLLMQVARALGSSGVKPRRSIAFFAFSGEEKGLLGSKYYVGSPLRPLSQTVAMLNMDMVGRNFDSGCEVIGTQHAPLIREIIEEQRKPSRIRELVFKTGKDQDIINRSDQAPFLQKGIPIAFFTTGLHGDYHRPSDHWNLIKTKNMAKIGHLVVRTVLRIANREGRPQYAD